MQRFLMAVDGSTGCNESLVSMARILKEVPDCKVLLYHCVQSLGSAHFRALGELSQHYEVSAEAEKRMGGGILEQSRNVFLEHGFPESNI
ncbi:MAG: hypothetical protein RBS57_20710, partial [Desulforhabdus sp.]|nr:hypothetical protein [Desulforhabdus sp.]